MQRQLRTDPASRGVIILTFVLAVTLCLVSTATGQITLINVIPAANTGETNNDQEASLAISGTNVVIPTFTPSTAPPGTWNGAGPGVAAPYWFSGGGGAAGTWAQNIGAYPEPVPAATGPNDQTVAFNPAGGTLYSALLSLGDSTDYIFSTGAVAGASALLAARNGTLAFAAVPDQPFVTQESVTTIPAPPPAALAALGAGDVLFYGINPSSGLGTNAATAVRITPGPGRPAPQRFLLETITPAGGNGPPVRVAVASDGSTVYAVWQRRTAFVGGGDQTGDIVIRRSLNLGIDGYINPGFAAAGNNVTPAPIRIPIGTKLGSERLQSDLSIAVDPRNPFHVYVAYAEVIVIGGVPVPFLRVRFNAAGGGAGTPWVLVGSFGNAALPALAIANNGALGLLYAAQSPGRVIFHFAQSPAGAGVPRFRDPPGPGGEFVVPGPDMNLILENSIDPIPRPVLLPQPVQPYYGDYHFLLAQGNTFFGAFASSNNFDGDDAVQFPNGVVFQRTDRFVGGSGPGFVASIDPFFMTEEALAPLKVVPLVTSFKGTAAVGFPAGFGGRGGIRITGIFTSDGDLDLSVPGATSTISSLFREAGVELVANLPSLLLAAPGNIKNVGTFKTPGSLPFAKVTIGALGRGRFNYSLDVSNATIANPRQCPKTNLLTSFRIDDIVNRPVEVTVFSPWLCFGIGPITAPGPGGIFIPAFKYMRTP